MVTIMDQILNKFQSLQKAAIDSSSIIYMRKSGFFDAVKDELTLYAIPEVVEETGFQDLDIEICSLSWDGLTTDEKVLLCAQEKRIAIISEDKGMFLKAEQEGKDYFNALVILHFLAFKGAVNQEQHDMYLNNLLGVARYGPEVLELGQEIYWQVQKERKGSHGKRRSQDKTR